MKRKTNLFYTSGPDSNFLTFSNYTEALTGNFLSVNSKLFPDKFLCLKINGLNESNKPEFIKYLAAYYENKLAALRDDIIKEHTIETNIYPLAYLLEGLLRILTYNDNEWTLNLSVDNSYNENSDNIKNLITYIGDITEFDYNGIYTDTICNINMNSYNEAEIEFGEIGSNIKTYTISSNILYGWENDNLLFAEYSNVTPIYDTAFTYSYNTCLSRIVYNRIEETNEKYGNDVQFNIVIPLFNYINIDADTNSNAIVNRIDPNTQKEYFNLRNNETGDNKAIYDVPLGIWIYANNPEKESFITLEKDKNLNLYPSWSLLISSQFKPFPYSNKLDKTNSATESILNGYPTFAEVVSKMNKVLDKFSDVEIKIQNLSNKLESLETKINTIGTESNISNLDKKIIDIQSSVDGQITEFKQQIYSYINDLKWSSVG